MWLLAGPNGAGKSTFTCHGVIREISGQAVLELNADERAQQIRQAEPEAQDIELRAARETDAAVAACIERGDDFLIETVLSTDKYIDDVEFALQLGFRIGMVYVALATPQDAIRRVALRVSQHGHNVPADRIAPRWARSISMLGRFVPLCECLYVFDNSGPATHGDPVLIAYKNEEGRIVLLGRGQIPSIDQVLLPFL